jgi:hypothetical protein
MGTGKRRTSTAAPLGGKLVALELGMSQVTIGLAQEPEVETLELEIVLAQELETSAPAIGQVPEPVLAAW